jgi:hypothetical protein
MPDIVTSQVFSDGEKGITSSKMNNIIANSVIQPDFVLNKPTSSTLDPTDQLLEVKGSGAYARITGQQLINSVSASVNQNFFVTKTSAYILTTADSGKYVICSGGSWTLTLPVPVVGLNYRLRNDMGISGTTGTIILQPTGGTIDGQASIPLLPQQECTLITDGTNWRTIGLKREVILGTQDITTAQANGVILLPAGYRYFELELTSFTPVTNQDYLVAQVSSDGGNTWYTASYYVGGIYDSSATTVAFSQVINTSSWTIGQSQATGSNTGELRMVLYPGSASTAPTFHADSTNFISSLMYKWLVGGFLNTLVRINALKYFGALGGNFTSLLTVKGVV